MRKSDLIPMDDTDRVILETYIKLGGDIWEYCKCAFEPVYSKFHQCSKCSKKE